MANKILVTGGCGYIGSHTVVELLENNYEVIIVDNLFNSDEKVVASIEKITNKKIQFVNIDLSDRVACAALFANNSDIDAVIHFAAYKAVAGSVEKPLEYYYNNLNSLINVLEGMKSIGCKELVFSSSCAVYGQAKVQPVTENTPIKTALTPYGNTKIVCENILSDFAVANKDYKIIILRYFNPIGAHKSALIGELPNGTPDNLMPYITQTAAGIRECLSVFGNDYDTPDGTPIRDYIHVVDLATAHIKAMGYMVNGDFKGVDYFNIGTGNGYSVLDIIKSFEKTSGKKLNYKIVGRRAGDIEIVWGDANKAKELMGWEAKLGLDDMTLSAWRWQIHLSDIE